MPPTTTSVHRHEKFNVMSDKEWDERVEFARKKRERVGLIIGVTWRTEGRWNEPLHTNIQLN